MKRYYALVYEDDELVAVNKAPGLLSIPDREGKEISLKKLLEDRFGTIFTVHRLDKETSGLIVFARSEASHRRLSLQFEHREAEKIYQGLVLGSLAEPAGTVDAPIAEHPAQKGMMIVKPGGKPSRTDYRVLEDFGKYSWMQFRLHTGRTHQIRVHMKHLGHPVACDHLYGDGRGIFLSGIKHSYRLSKLELEERPLLDRLGLHAASLRLCSPDGKQLLLEAELPKDLRAVLRQLAINKKGSRRS